MITPGRRILGLSVLLFAALLATYSNHFQNSFHFDDWHTVTGNPWIRNLGNLPRFFTDSRTMSVLPASQSYRPLLTASLALDYRLGGGLKALYFHASTFFWYVLLLVLMFFLFHSVMQRIEPRERNAYLALFAAGWFALHPVSVETVNYVIQRADLYVALGVVAGMVLYIRFPGARKWGLYLVPVALAGLAKLTAVMFPAILAVYIYLFEAADGPTPPVASWKKSRAWTAFRGAAPAFLLAAGNCLLTSAMTQKTFNAGGASLYRYLITQPRVTLHYFFSFFLPIGLTADTDRPAFEGFWNEDAILGVVFLAVLVGGAVYLSRRRPLRPIAFGVWWFLLALVPTAAMPLAEVENDHRMFAPFAGLVLSATWGAALLWDRFAGRLRLGRFQAATPWAAAVCLLAACAAGAYHRNEVWRTEETLWLDVVQKSPRNGRGLMNYGLTRMSKGDYQGALDYFTRAQAYTPNYSILEVNLGIAFSGLKRVAEAESHFRRALELAPADAVPKYYYARWLREQDRIPECIRYLRESLQQDPLHHDARALLMEVYAQAGNWGEFGGLAEETQRLFPGDTVAADILGREKSR